MVNTICVPVKSNTPLKYDTYMRYMCAPVMYPMTQTNVTNGQYLRGAKAQIK